MLSVGWSSWNETFFCRWQIVLCKTAEMRHDFLTQPVKTQVRQLRTRVCLGVSMSLVAFQRSQGGISFRTLWKNHFVVKNQLRSTQMWSIGVNSRVFSRSFVHGVWKITVRMIDFMCKLIASGSTLIPNICFQCCHFTLSVLFEFLINFQWPLFYS